MKLLLDTHVFIWVVAEPERLSPRALSLVQDAASELYLSAASSWEITVKHALGKIAFPWRPATWIAKAMNSHSIRELPIAIRHTTGVAELPSIHKDRFDRILVAQARADGLTILTRDSVVRRYPVPTVWE